MACVMGCRPGLQIFRFPSQTIRRQKWFEALGLEPTTKINLFVCARHFSKSMLPSTKLIYPAVPDVHLERDVSPTKEELKQQLLEALEETKKVKLLLEEEQNAHSATKQELNIYKKELSACKRKLLCSSEVAQVPWKIERIQEEGLPDTSENVPKKAILFYDDDQNFGVKEEKPDM